MPDCGAACQAAGNPEGTPGNRHGGRLAIGPQVNNLPHTVSPRTQTWHGYFLTIPNCVDCRFAPLPVQLLAITKNIDVYGKARRIAIERRTREDEEACCASQTAARQAFSAQAR